MKIISLWQPWASLWAGGKKRIETRSWAPAYAAPVDFAIHAAKRFPRELAEMCQQEPFRSALAELGYHRPADLPLGAVVGIARVVAFVRINPHTPLPLEPERSFGDYTGGRWKWESDGNRLLATPVPLRGQQRDWNWTPPGSLAFRDGGEMTAAAAGQPAAGHGTLWEGRQ